MVRRVTENRSDTPLNIRLPANLKIEVDKQADLENVSTAEWVRKVLQEKIDCLRAQKEVVDFARVDAAAADMEARVRQLVLQCLNDAGVPYRKDSAAAAAEEQRAAGSAALPDNP